MTLICAKADDTSDKLVTEAIEIFERASAALNDMIRKLEAGDFSEAGDARKIVANLEKASELSFQARLKLDERNKKQRGIAHDYAIDFTAARSEIGRRLACLRRAGGEGSVSE